VRSQVFRDERRRRQDVVVDEDDPLAHRPRDPDVARACEARVRLIDRREPARRPRASLLDHARRVVARPVVHEHDLVRVASDRLLETAVEHAAEQVGAIVRTELNRRAHRLRISSRHVG
jgi:hypothetical protein